MSTSKPLALSQPHIKVKPVLKGWGGGGGALSFKYMSAGENTAVDNCSAQDGMRELMPASLVSIPLI